MLARLDASPKCNERHVVLLVGPVAMQAWSARCAQRASGTSLTSTPEHCAAPGRRLTIDRRMHQPALAEPAAQFEREQEVSASAVRRSPAGGDAPAEY
jgi:hypothetical protein